MFGLERPSRSNAKAAKKCSKTTSKQIDTEDVSVRRAFVLRPAGMDACITTVERAIVPGESMRIRIRLRKLNPLESAAGLGLVFDEPGSLFVAGHHPDGIFHPGRAVCPRHVIWDEELRLPRLRVHSKNSPQP